MTNPAPGRTKVRTDMLESRCQWTPVAIDHAMMADAAAWLDAQLGISRCAGSSTLRTAAVDAPVSRQVPTIVEQHPAADAEAGTKPADAGVLARAAPTAFLLLLFNAAVAMSEILAARVFAVSFVLVIPGAVVLAASRTRPHEGAVRLAAAAAASMLYLMLAALAADSILPLFGIAEPLARTPMLIVVDTTLTLLLIFVARHRDPLVELFGPRLPGPRQAAAAAALATLPVLAAAGAQAVDHGRGPTLAISALVASGVLMVGLLVGAYRLPNWFVPAGLYAIAVAMTYSFTFSGDRLFGWDIQQEFQAFSATFQSNAWYPVVDRDPYRAMLSITALPAVLARLTGMSGVSLFRGVYPLLFASFPVLVYVITARWLSKVAAFAAAAFVVVQLAFSQQLPAITRQEIALVFFGVLVAIAFDDTLPLPYRRVIALVAGSALAFTHYSTAYVTSLAMLGAWLLGAIIRFVRRAEAPRRVLALPIVIGILGFTVCWNFGVTQSSDNVVRFTEQAAERGPEFLPSGEGRSMIGRWLSGNAPQRITGEEYARRVDTIYDATAPWLNAYPDEVVADYPVTEAGSPGITGLVPQARPAQAALLVIASQGFVGLTSLGALLFAWRRRRDWSSARELATLGVALLMFVAAMRVSGVAAEAYNQERAQIHASVVLSVGLAALLAWFLSRWRRVTLVLAGSALAVVFLASSGLATRIVGGAAPANLADIGDAKERFSVNDIEVSTAEWLATNRYPDSIVIADRYGQLRIWAAAVAIGEQSLQSALTPATLDRNAYVFATAANVVGGRARGAIGADYAVYTFPRAFLDANKAAIYSTGTTVVFR